MSKFYTAEDHEQYLAEKAAAEAAAEARAAAEHQAHLDKVRAEHVRKRLTYLRPIAAAIRANARPHDVVLDEENGTLIVDGVHVESQIYAREEYSRNGFRSKPTGKVRLTVGDYGNRTSFPQRKDGTHNYEDISHLLIGYASRRKEANKMEATRKVNQAIVTDFVATHADTQYGRMQVRPSADAGRPLMVKVDISRAMTPLEATALHAALTSLGLLK